MDEIEQALIDHLKRRYYEEMYFRQVMNEIITTLEEPEGSDQGGEEQEE